MKLYFFGRRQFRQVFDITSKINCLLWVVRSNSWYSVLLCFLLYYILNIVNNTFITMLHQCQPFLRTLSVRVQKKHRFVTAVVNFVGYLDEIALEGNNKKSDSTTRLLCLTFSSPLSVLLLQTAQGRQKEMCVLSRVFQNKIQQCFCLATCFFFSLPEWLSGSVGDRKSGSDPQLIEHLTPNGTDLLRALSHSKRVSACAGAHMCTRNGTISVGSQGPILGRVAVVLHVEMSFLLLEMLLLIWQLWHHSSRSQFSVSFLPPSICNSMTHHMCQHVS